MNKFILLMMFVLGLAGTLVAQDVRETENKKLETYKSRYASGDRKIGFMQEYVMFLLEKKKLGELEDVADEYLRLVPVKKRYEGDNLKILLNGVKDYEAIPVRELVMNWDKRVKLENREALVMYVEDVYMFALFNSRLNKQKVPDNLAKMMRHDLAVINSPLKEYRLGLLDLAIASDKGDVGKIIELSEKHVAQVNMKYLKNWKDGLVINSAFNVVLEKANQEECERMIEFLKPLMAARTKDFINIMHDNFVGKLMSFDVGEKKKFVTRSREMKEIKDEKEVIDGFHFNTSVGGVMTEKEYQVLRDVFNSDDEILKNKHLHTVIQVFRYNGYTAGLESLKSLIEKNVKDCEEKREVLSRYASYAHLAVGKFAPEFKLKDVNGKEYALSDYNGKVVVIDVWATWCGGCIEKLPYFLRVRDHFKAREDVVFIVISIDEENMYNRWKFSQPLYNLIDVISLIAHPKKCSFSDDYNITGIPRYFVIDRDGKIVNVYSPAPDDARFIDLISNTLKMASSVF